MRTLRLSALAALAVCIAGASHAQTPKLKELSQAPPIKVAKWVKGTPVPTLQKGKTYVVEFWATWCGPCKVSIPHITELAKKYAGEATFVGVSVWERKKDNKDTSYMPKVEQFVKEMGDKMAYSVAMDGPEGTMASTWMQASGQGGIPAAFIVGPKGDIQWIGHPMDKMDEALAGVIAGTFDAKAAAAQREKQQAMAKKQQELAKKQQELMQPVIAAFQKQDWKTALAELDKIMAANPDMKAELSQTKVMLLMRGDEVGFYAYAKELAATQFKDDAMMLNQLAWQMVDDRSPLKTRDYPTALAIAQRANEVGGGKDPNVLDTLGLAYFKAGDKAKAVETQTLAIELASKAGSNVPAETLKELKDRLEEFKK